MKKLTKRTLGLVPVIAISPILTSCSCASLLKKWAISDEDMIKTPKPNPTTPVQPGTEETKAEPESKEGYITYDTTLPSNKRTFLKDNNVYYFKDLKHEEELYPEEHYLNEELYKDIKMYPSILISWDEKDEQKVHLLEENEPIKDLLKMDPESPYKIHNANRQFFNLDYKLQPGRYYGYMHYMTKYLKNGHRLKVLKGKKGIPEDVVKRVYINSYSYPAEVLPKNFFENYLDFGKDKDEKGWWKNGKYNIYGENNLTRFSSKGWPSIDDLATKAYFLPFTRSKHGFYNIYKDAEEYTHYYIKEDFLVSGKKKYWVHDDIIINTCVRNVRTIQLSEKYNNLYNNYFSLLKTINEGHPSKIFEPFSDIKNLEKVKERLKILVDACSQLLSWDRLLGEEVESFYKKNRTFVKMFPSFELKQVTDFEYDYIFTYELLHEVLLPLMCSLKMDLPLLYKMYEKSLRDEEIKPIYEYLYFYMNKLFEDKICPFNNKKYPELKLITRIKEKFEDTEYQEEALQKALKFIKVWSDRLELGFDTTTF